MRGTGVVGLGSSVWAFQSGGQPVVGEGWGEGKGGWRGRGRGGREREAGGA